MAGGAYVTRFKEASYNFYKWRFESSLLVKIGLAGVFAGLTGLGAHMRFYIPWTLVPITGQVFFVLAAGLVLGRHFGGLSQIIYALVGIAGVPWFAGTNTVPAYHIVAGPTFGYIIGFILTAFLIGGAVDRRVLSRRFSRVIPLLLAGILLIYVAGAMWFFLWWTTGFGVHAPLGTLGLNDLFLMTVVPFIPLDILKALIVAGIGGFVLPKRAYGTENDA